MRSSKISKVLLIGPIAGGALSLTGTVSLGVIVRGVIIGSLIACFIHGFFSFFALVLGERNPKD
ncbi:MAG: hypothetical protein CBC37_00155 [Acidimicrobiaceae bacterium TMED77]|nr:MAG: hypothetical protein CBC37_00155 [Acidimicrobiaceae bacterium TMED77]